MTDPEYRENQNFLTAERHGDAIHIELSCEGTFSVEEYEQFLNEVKRTAWITLDSEQFENDESVTKLGDKYVGEGECHECGYEGYIAENDIGTVYCPKCRSTNVGWPVR